MTENVLAFPQEESTLFPVIITDTGDQFVDARALHCALEVGRDFSNWIKDRIEKYGFFDGVDFQTCSPELASEKDFTPDSAKRGIGV